MGCTAVQRKRIVTTRGLRKLHYARGSRHCKFATTLETISAMGTVVPLFFLLSDAHHIVGWYTNLPNDEASFAVQANTTMDIKLVLANIEEHLDKH